MISSLILIILNLLGKTNPDISLGFFKWYFLALGIEVAVILFLIKKLGKWDRETNFGRKE